MSNEATTRTQSTFTGGAFSYFFRNLAVALVSSITAGLLYPVMYCWQQRWVAEHTFYNGRKLTFDGKGGQLFGKYIIWFLLTVVTLGIYSLWVPIKMEKWRVSHLHFEDGTSVENGSHFDGSALGYIGRSLLVGLVISITLGIGMFWGICYLQRWMTKNTVIDGAHLKFEGTAIKLFGKMIVWFLLTIVTLGIYSFWLPVKETKWFVSYTNIVEE